MHPMLPRPPTPLPAITALHKPHRFWWPVGLGVLLGGALQAFGAESLAQILDTVAAGARYGVPLQADLRIECTPACTTQRGVLLGRGDVVYVEARDGQRALVRPDGIHIAKDGHAVAASPDAALGDTGVLLRDLAVFTPASLALPQISDDGPTGVVITSAPTGRSPYVLVVHTIDRERHAIVKTQYYADSIGHLAKIRRDGDLTNLGGGWRPATVIVERFDPSRSTRIALTWRTAPDAPSTLFEPAGLETPSGLRWADEQLGR